MAIGLGFNNIHGPFPAEAKPLIHRFRLVFYLVPISNFDLEISGVVLIINIRFCFGVVNLQPGFRIGKAHKWWEKGIQPNMKEVTCAQDLVDSLLNAGDKLVVLDFFSPGCGGCKALHPKVKFTTLIHLILYGVLYLVFVFFFLISEPIEHRMTNN